MAPRFDKFTDRAKRVLTYAQEEAQRFSHSHIGTEHPLLGLLRVTDGVGAAVLATFGVGLETSREAIEYIIGRESRPVRGEIGLTPAAKKVIELAVTEDRRMKVDPGTEHLLIGLVAEKDGIAARVLRTHGCTLDAVRGATTREFVEWVHAQRAANSRDTTRSSRELNRVQSAQAAIQEALDAVSAAPLSRFERDLLDLLLVPQLIQISGHLHRAAYGPSLPALRQEAEEALRLLAQSAEIFRSHGLPGVAYALDSAWLAVRRVLL